MTGHDVSTVPEATGSFERADGALCGVSSSDAARDGGSQQGDLGRPVARATREQRQEARRLAIAAIRHGGLVRPHVCSECHQARGTIHAHHDDYSKPLAVRWLCEVCHLAWHALHPVEPGTFKRSQDLSLLHPDSWPVALTLQETAHLTRQSLKPFYRRVQQGTSNPMPVLDARGMVQKPIRFNRAEVRRFVGEVTP